MMQRQAVRVGGFEFDLRVWGPPDGAPVMLLHGFPETGRAWERVAPALAAAGMRVIAPDQRGYSPGARPSDPHEYDIAKLSGDVIGLLDALDIDTVHLVGHDWGAAVAWQVAASHPHRLRSLVAVSVPHPAAMTWAIRNDPDQRRRSAYMLLFRDPAKAERVLLAAHGAAFRALFGTHVEKAAVDDYLAHLRQPGALVAALNWYRAMGRGFGDVPAVRVPTTYLWSTGDPALGEVGARRCAQHVDADYQFVVLPGVSHWIPEQAPEVVVEAVRKHAAAAIAS